ncbi:MAG: hypothetical protein AB1630_07635 [bacterium]
MNKYEGGFYLFRVFAVYAVEALFLAASIGWFTSHLLKNKFFSKNVIREIIGWWVVVCIGIGIVTGIDLVKMSLDLNCFSDNMPMVEEWCENYAKKHGGIYPTYGDELNLKAYYGDNPYFPEKLVIGSQHTLLTCPDTGALYKWSKKHYTVNDSPDTMLFWCGKPHGLIFKWRNVKFIGGIQQVPEGEFQKLLKEQQGETKQK